MPRRSREEIRVVLCLFLVLFLGVADSQIVSPLLPAIRARVGRSSLEMGYLFTGYSLSAGISVLIWGPLSDLFGRRRGLLAGLGLFASGSCISFLSATYGGILGGRVITGMGASMLSLNTISYAADFFPYANRGWAMGSIFSSYFAALILGVPLGSLVGDALGWNAVFGISGILALLLAALSIVLLPPPAGHAGEVRTPVSLIRHARVYLDFATSRGSLGALVSSCLTSAGTTGFLAFVGIWLHDVFGKTSREISLVFLTSGAAALLASPFAGTLSDRFGKKLQFVCSNVVFALLLLVLPRLAWGVALFVVFCGISLCAAFRQGPMEALITEVVPAATRGSFVALRNCFSQLGIALAALASGKLFDVSGYGAICLLCSALTLASAAGMTLLVRHEHL